MLNLEKEPELKTMKRIDGNCRCQSWEDMFSCAGYKKSQDIVMPEVCGNLDRLGCEKCLYVE